MTNLSLMIIIVALYACSAFFSGTETGVYRLSRFRLRLGVEQHRPFYKKLSQAVEDGQGLILSLLLGNNLVNYLATMLTTWLLLRLLENKNMAELYTAAIITPTLFIFGEIIPKSVFFYRADALMGFLAPAVWGTWRILTASRAIRLLRWLLGLFSRILGLSVDTAAAVDVTQRSQVRQLLQETREEGLLSSLQKDIIQRLGNIPEVAVRTIVVPIQKTEMAEVNGTRQELLQILARCPHRRIPVYEKDRNNILGYVDIERALAAENELTSLRTFLSPIARLGASASVLDAISILRKGSHRIAVVVADRPAGLFETRKVLGVLTLKDLVEELTGELTGH